MIRTRETELAKCLAPGAAFGEPMILDYMRKVVKRQEGRRAVAKLRPLPGLSSYGLVFGAFAVARQVLPEITEILAVEPPDTFLAVAEAVLQHPPAPFGSPRVAPIQPGLAKTATEWCFLTLRSGGDKDSGSRAMVLLASGCLDVDEDKTGLVVALGGPLALMQAAVVIRGVYEERAMQDVRQLHSQVNALARIPAGLASASPPPPPPSAPRWDADPTGRHEVRYWDGSRWTEHVGDQGAQAMDPV